MIVEEILGVCKRLDAAKSLQGKHVIDVLTDFGICTIRRFRDLMKHLKQNAELDNLHILGTIPPYASPMEQIEAICEKAVDIHDKLCTAQIWNRTTNQPTADRSKKSAGGTGQTSSGGGVGSTLVSIDCSKIEQSLADFERNSTDPNASQLSEMFRTMLLK